MRSITSLLSGQPRGRGAIQLGAWVLALGLSWAAPLTGQARATEEDPGPACQDRPYVYHTYALADATYDYGRILEITGAAAPQSRLLQRASGSYRVPVCDEPATLLWGHKVADAADPVGPQVTLLPFTVHGFYNSGYPIDRNNGSAWSGVGGSGLVRAGLRFEYGAFSAAFAPEAVVAQNEDFDTVEPGASGFSRFIYPSHRTLIDFPQRFGDDVYTELFPGQSYIRLDAYGAAAGISTENMWWGPARRYPLLLSNTAPGVPHLFLGTSDPVDIWIGDVEAEVFWGLLRESDFFDGDEGNDNQLLSGFAGTFQPRGADGLYLGFARMFEAIGESLEGADFLTRPFTSLSDNPRGEDNILGDNVLFALWLRFVLPESGFEVYGEWGREDNFEDLDDLVREPDHSQGFTLGFQKIFDAGQETKVRVKAELAHLDVSESVQSGRPVPTFYVHGQVHQGYTNKGQLLGAFIGPGSNAQYIGVDVLGQWGLTGLFVERIRHDSDEYFFRWAPSYGPQAHDIELAIGIEQVLFAGPFQVSGTLAYHSRTNRNFIGLRDFTFDFIQDQNLNLEIGVEYLPDVDLSGLLSR